MRLIKVFNEGRIINERLYNELQDLEMNKVPEFNGCGNEFKPNRDWWVGVEDGQIIAYCGCLYSHTFCLFNRSWVHPKYRGNGIQKKLIKVREKAAREKDSLIITYITIDNPASGNNLISQGFKMYTPSWQYAGTDKVYFKKDFK